MVALQRRLATFSVSRDGRIVAWDEEMALATGLSRERVLGRPCYECIGFHRVADGRGLCSADCAFLVGSRSFEPRLGREMVMVREETAVMTVVALQTGADEGSWSAVHALRFPEELTLLTPTEARVLAHLAEGRGTGEIAESLAIRRNTVRTHVRRLLEKLGARNRVEALSRLSGADLGEPPVERQPSRL
jgi:DNA-binding CsgD family transcriptional regulator